jgi:CRISPR-associated protein Csb2
MLALEVEYLMGRVLATRRDDRRAVEWPPHPARLFAALVAAFKECELGSDVRRALEWLEALPEPSIYANPPEHDGNVREVRDVFVPVNDPKPSSIPVLPEKRSRQLRWFPAYTPNDRIVYFIWNDAALDTQTLTALQEVAQNVTYLGHSMSPVRVAVRNDTPEPTLVPFPQGEILLRTTGQGRLQYLETLHSQRLENALLQPRLGQVSGYRVQGKPCEISPRSLYHHVYILQKTQGYRLPLESAHGVCRLVRKALMELCADPLPEIISGHTPDRKTTEKPHLALIPLANVGNRHAEGHIMGVAVLMPENSSRNDLDHLEAGLENLESLTLGRLGKWDCKWLDAESLEAAPKTLQPVIYSRKHTDWATVTPIVFGHFPKNKPGKDALAVIGKACRDIGLPEPVEVNIVPASVFKGAPPAKLFTHNEDFQKTAYLLGKLTAHVILRFDVPVQGPVILGAGRFLGLGLCRPYYRGKEKTHAIQ